MKILGLLLLGFASMSPSAGSSPTARRDAALKEIDACLQRHEVSSRDCKNLNANVDTLVAVYKRGDRTVLPILFQFTYLTAFYGDALLADPNGFLKAMSDLVEKDQKAVAVGLAGGTFGLNRERFEAIRDLLRNIPESESISKASQLCLKVVETRNAARFVTYFPPQTFTTRSADFQVRWYSRDMYALGETPLWPLSGGVTTFRFTYLPAFTGPTAITLTVSGDGEGRITIKTITRDREGTSLDETVSVPKDQQARFLTLLDRAHFWAAPTELPNRGLDGAEWIIEAAQGGNYHTVVRWCPGFDHPSADGAAFADAGRFLFELAGHKHGSGC